MIAVYRWEVAKLLAQKRTYLGFLAAIAIPLIFVTVLLLKSGGPNDALLGLGSKVRDTGLVVPFVVLFFMSFWAFPLIASLVAGDIVASARRIAPAMCAMVRRSPIWQDGLRGIMQLIMLDQLEQVHRRRSVNA